MGELGNFSGADIKGFTSLQIIEFLAELLVQVNTLAAMTNLKFTNFID